MKPVFAILLLSISLSACAQPIVTAESEPCKDAAAVRTGGSAALLGSGSPNFVMPIARDVPGLSRVSAGEVASKDCTHLQNGRSPRTYDLHKIGDEPADSDALIAQNANPSCPKARGEKA